MKGKDKLTHQVEQAVLDEIIRRIVEVAQPEKIIMFGSAARGEMGPHSDVDLLSSSPTLLIGDG
jgi:predicted nucleotidyltransferase